MLNVKQPTLSHFGIYVADVEKMVRFYKSVFGLVETDRGVGKTFTAPLIFLSASPHQHHQLVIAGGRPAEAAFSTVIQSPLLCITACPTAPSKTSTWSATLPISRF